MARRPGLRVLLELFPEETRIVVLGKTGVGKSSLANTVFGEEVFEESSSAISVTPLCKSFTEQVHGHLVKWVDTPGLFDTERDEEELKQEIIKCITECYPGPHVFLLLLPVGRFTAQEEEVIEKFQEYFSEGALKFTIVLFTHGDDLDEGTTIQDFAFENEGLRQLLQKCGNRVHVVDNRRWRGDQHGYRSNQYQVSELFRTIEEIKRANGGCHYSQQPPAAEFAGDSA